MAFNNKAVEGQKTVYKGETKDIIKKQLRVKCINYLEKQIQLDTIDLEQKSYILNFWKTSNVDEVNMINNNGECYLRDISPGNTYDFIGFEYYYNGTLQFAPVGGYELSTDNIQLKLDLNANKLIDTLNTLIDAVHDDKLRDCCNKCIELYHNDLYKKPAAQSHHHNYAGGLLQHTVEVMSIAYNVGLCVKCDLDIVLVSALFHDVMKIAEYSDDGNFLPFGSEIGHVVGSAEVFKNIATECGVDRSIVNKIFHCILSHHGKKEWGSPVEPNIPEAVILHNADMVSAAINPMYIKANTNNSKDYYLPI